MWIHLRPAAGRSHVVRATPAKPAGVAAAAPRARFWDLLRRCLGAVAF